MKTCTMIEENLALPVDIDERMHEYNRMRKVRGNQRLSEEGKKAAQHFRANRKNPVKRQYS